MEYELLQALGRKDKEWEKKLANSDLFNFWVEISWVEKLLKEINCTQILRQLKLSWIN